MNAVQKAAGRFDRDRLRQHINDPLYRTGYFLIIGTGVTSVLGVVFWALAAHAYTAHHVGLNAAAISAMTLVSGACSLGLAAVLVRYLPIAGSSTHRLVTRAYVLTGVLSVVIGALAALTSNLWSPKLSFLSEGTWLIGFAVSCGAFTIFTLQDSVLTGMRTAQWIPLENTLYSVAKIVLLVGLAAGLPSSGLFVAWNVPLLPVVIVINYLIFRRLIPAAPTQGSLERRKMFAMATGNYGGNLFSLFGNLFLPILVANITTAEEAAFFYVPWLICVALQLVAINVMTSLTVEAALDMEVLGRLARRSLTHSMRLMLPLAILTAALAPIGLLAFGHDYADAGTSLLRWLALGAVPNVIVQLGISIGRLEHRGWIVVLTQGASTILLIGISVLLLPGMGIEGVGVAWAASQFVIAAILAATLLRPLLLPDRHHPVAEGGPE